MSILRPKGTLSCGLLSMFSPKGTLSGESIPKLRAKGTLFFVEMSIFQANEKKKGMGKKV
ncbi:MAG: hypothetical protein GTO20_09305 [Candidatus Aminicenantes bacterium]|nr:hypothetical protein [Candidatus Aminicenantes bacterium]